MKSAERIEATLHRTKRLERTRRERASLVSCVGEPLKRNVMLLLNVLRHATLNLNG
jgi:hypothetical protein